MKRRRSIAPVAAAALLLLGISAVSASAQAPTRPAQSPACLRALEQADVALWALAQAQEATVTSLKSGNPEASLHANAHARDAVRAYGATRDTCREARR